MQATPSGGANSVRFGADRRLPWAARQQGYTLIDIMVVVGMIGVVAGIAVPITSGAISNQRFSGDSKALTNTVGLAKMRASATFTRARVRANLATNTYVLERWDKDAGAWTLDGGQMRLSSGVRFGYGALSTPPPDTQDTIKLSPSCRVGSAATSATIANTACIVFNSRGLPVDGGGAPFLGGHALYLTDGNFVGATTVTATPRIRRWSSPAGTVRWSEQQ